MCGPTAPRPVFMPSQTRTPLPKSLLPPTLQWLAFGEGGGHVQTVCRVNEAGHVVPADLVPGYARVLASAAAGLAAAGGQPLLSGSGHVLVVGAGGGALPLALTAAARSAAAASGRSASCCGGGRGAGCCQELPNSWAPRLNRLSTLGCS